MQNEKNRESVEDLLEQLFEEEDFERCAEISERVLELDPGNPIATYIRWQSLEDEESMENLDMLRGAVDRLRPSVSDDAEPTEELRAVYVSMLSDLASCCYFGGEKEAALAAAEEFMEKDMECQIVGRLVFYSILIERGEYARVVEEADADVCESVMGEYARAIALFEQEGATSDASDSLLEAISLDPDLVFYLIGLWTVDEEDLEDDDEGLTEELMMNVAALSELWAASEERLAFISIVAFAFGYLTGRMGDPEELRMLEEGYKNLGCLEEMREARDTLHAMIASGKEPQAVDEEALMLFRDMREQGLFS